MPILDALGGMSLADPTRDAGPQQDDDDRLVLRFLSEFVDPGTPVPRQPRPLSIGRGLALDGSAPRRTSVALFRGLRPLEAASEAERLAGSVPTMSRTTANGHIGAMSNRDEIPLSWGAEFIETRV